MKGKKRKNGKRMRRTSLDQREQRRQFNKLPHRRKKEILQIYYDMEVIQQLGKELKKFLVEVKANPEPETLVKKATILTANIAAAAKTMILHAIEQSDAEFKLIKEKAKTLRYTDHETLLKAGEEADIEEKVEPAFDEALQTYGEIQKGVLESQLELIQEDPYLSLAERNKLQVELSDWGKTIMLDNIPYSGSGLKLIDRFTGFDFERDVWERWSEGMKRAQLILHLRRANFLLSFALGIAESHLKWVHSSQELLDSM